MPDRSRKHLPGDLKLPASIVVEATDENRQEPADDDKAELASEQRAGIVREETAAARLAGVSVGRKDVY